MAACEAGENTREGTKDSGPTSLPLGFLGGVRPVLYPPRGKLTSRWIAVGGCQRQSLIPAPYPPPSGAVPALPPSPSLLPRRCPRDGQGRCLNQTRCFRHLAVPSDICWALWSLRGAGAGVAGSQGRGPGRLGRALRGHDHPLPQSFRNGTTEGLRRTGSRAPTAPHSLSKGLSHGPAPPHTPPVPPTAPPTAWLGTGSQRLPLCGLS